MCLQFDCLTVTLRHCVYVIWKMLDWLKLWHGDVYRVVCYYTHSGCCLANVHFEIIKGMQLVVVVVLVACISHYLCGIVGAMCSPCMFSLLCYPTQKMMPKSYMYKCPPSFATNTII